MSKMKFVIGALFYIFSYTSAFAGSVVSPYWQYDAGSYTFVGVSNPSSNAQNVTITAILDSSSLLGSASFTIAGGTTQRVFIVVTNHATVNTSNITDAKFIAGSARSGVSFGQFTVDASVDASKLIYQGGVIFTQNGAGFATGTFSP